MDFAAGPGVAEVEPGDLVNDSSLCPGVETDTLRAYIRSILCIALSLRVTCALWQFERFRFARCELKEHRNRDGRDVGIDSVNPALPLLLLGSSTDLCTRVELNVAVQHDSRANFACRRVVVYWRFPRKWRSIMVPKRLSCMHVTVSTVTICFRAETSFIKRASPHSSTSVCLAPDWIPPCQTDT